jgi:hypothetical protein
LFDTYPAAREERDTASQPFYIPQDYIDYVDGKTRNEGVRSLLLSGDINRPSDTVDAPDSETVCCLGKAENIHFNDVIDEEGVEVVTGAVSLSAAPRAVGIETACVSTSKNCRPMRVRTGFLGLFDVIIDSLDLPREGLPGKPEPDAFLRSAVLLGTPQRSALVEDVITGTQAGRAGAFALVTGIDGGAGRDALLANRTDIVDDNLAVLLPEASETSSPSLT